MCQYFWIPAGETVDEKKLRASVVVNPHGWGLLFRPKPKGKGPWPFKKKLWVKEGENNDPDIIVKLINKTYKHYDRLLHLRFVTKGALSEENAHPFLVYEDGKDQVWMAHNGTLYAFAPKKDEKDDRSDSRVFAEEFLAPIFEAAKNPAEIPSVFHEIIDSKVTGQSRVILVSSRRKHPVIFNHSLHYYEWKDGENAEKKKIAWLAANKYSFDEDHRKPKKSAVSTTNYAWPSVGARRTVRRSQYETVVIAFAAFRKEHMKEADAWAEEKLAFFKRMGIANAYKALSYTDNFYLYSIKALLSEQERNTLAHHIAQAKAAKDSYIESGVPTLTDLSKYKKKDEEIPLERYKLPKTKVRGAFDYRWPPTEKDYFAEAKRVEKVDPYTKHIYPKVRMFFDLSADDMSPLTREHAVRTWLTQNSKHFDLENDVPRFIVSLAKLVEKLYEDIELLEESLEDFSTVTPKDLQEEAREARENFRWGLI